MRILYLLLFPSIAGCSKQPVTKVPTPPNTTPRTTPEPVSAEPVAASPQLAVSGDLVAQCRLQLEPANAPRFDFDAATLLPEDRDVLERIATCITSGPLEGRSLHLVGHTDPRGTAEYNLGLGDRRAQTVSDYLMRLGVARTQLVASTRGELDATGTDERSYAHDRRVDIVLQ